MESWNWRVQGLVWRVSVQFSWEVPESFVDNFGMHVIRVLGGVEDVFGLPSLATRSGFRFLVSLAVLGCGPCRGAVGRVGFRPSQMRSHCVSLALDMGDISRSPGPHIFPLFSPGSPTPLFSWVNHTPTVRQPKQVKHCVCGWDLWFCISCQVVGLLSLAPRGPGLK